MFKVAQSAKTTFNEAKLLIRILFPLLNRHLKKKKKNHPHTILESNLMQYSPQVVVQLTVNHTLWSGGYKFESLLSLLLRGHVKKKNLMKYLECSTISYGHFI